MSDQRGPAARPAAEHYITEEPYYLPQGEELQIARAAHRNGLPLLLKGPTGCGKTRFMLHLAWELRRPLISVSCHDDLSTGDLVGRYLIRGGDAVWVDGPLTTAVRVGAWTGAGLGLVRARLVGLDQVRDHVVAV